MPINRHLQRSIEFDKSHTIKSIGDVIIPKGVTSIGKNAFGGCNKLKSIIIPSSVTSISSAEMKGGGIGLALCNSLTNVSVSEGNKKYDSREGCNAIIETASNTLVEASQCTTIIPSSVTSIGEGAFSWCKLTSIKIPSSVTSIGSSAFSSNYSLKSIEIPSSVTSIGDYAFSGCSSELTIYGKANSYAETYAKKNNIKFSTGKIPQDVEKKVLLDSSVTLSKTSYAYDGKVKKPAVTVKDGTKVLKAGTDYTVSYQNNKNAGTAKAIVEGKGQYKGKVTKTFTIKVKKNSVYKIGFCQYKVTNSSAVSLTAIKDKQATVIRVPETVKIGGKNFKVTAIGKNAFKKNKKITKVEIGDNVKVIGAGAFEGCTKLNAVTVGRETAEIGKNTFKNCKKLKYITIKSTKLKKVGKDALKGIKSTARIRVPSQKLSAYQKLLKNKGQGKKVKIVK